MRRTLITGGTRGIGAAIAHRLAADGHELVLGYLSDAESAAATRDEIRALGVSCEIVGADITTDAGIAALFEAAGRVTGVVNNAGVTYRYAPLVETPTDEIRRTYDVNLVGPTLVARAAVSALAENEDGGVIVNISSGAATLGSPGEYVHYAAAKAGIDALTKGLGLEVASRGIRVVAVAPGLTETDLHAATGDPGRIERMAPQIPLGRASTPEEVAEAVAWLMSDQASYVTATTLRVAGGR
ncbi:NAD(P)-dependent dehydrogenase (short-subunit alcohol dehydrogenase family) [Nocardioides luteus]|uniref:Oxidoreductase n=1 Tax=Nocardioides luteus TaxID=1844 RepID=A0ABQ5SRS1_9ACTN|nr:SDR family oxidoreductase [Nocardioides luteus]MDR7313159.1 NAD(P)-dependent dehydrogenase (short-subunit alcohol dehydrogenase family) [Nocardioides luteus]GGR43692.1 oxidoreductase [Nocardioides luteus]GLJ66224.1 oxidoreductase [Nocardioides luteus]